MGLQFPVGRKTILLCDYGSGGFKPPEMVKRRPAIVITPRIAHRDGLCTVVPLSGTEPKHPVRYCVRLDLPEALPMPFAQKVWWAKCDMLATVAYERLDLFRTARGPEGRKYLTLKLEDDTFDKVMEGVLNGLAIGHLTLTRPGPHWS
jgi:mRNA interferase MazF